MGLVLLVDSGLHQHVDWIGPLMACPTRKKICALDGTVVRGYVPCP